MSNFVESSKLMWEPHEGFKPSIEDLKLGCLQRIATAVEKVAENYDALLRDRDWYKRRMEEERACSQRLARSNAALRGALTRIKQTK